MTPTAVAAADISVAIVSPGTRAGGRTGRPACRAALVSLMTTVLVKEHAQCKLSNVLAYAAMMPVIVTVPKASVLKQPGSTVCLMRLQVPLQSDRRRRSAARLRIVVAGVNLLVAAGAKGMAAPGEGGVEALRRPPQPVLPCSKVHLLRSSLSDGTYDSDSASRVWTVESCRGAVVQPCAMRRTT